MVVYLGKKTTKIHQQQIQTTLLEYPTQQTSSSYPPKSPDTSTCPVSRLKDVAAHCDAIVFEIDLGWREKIYTQPRP